MKRTFVLLAMMAIVLSVSAQKVKLVDGNLKFLKGQKEIKTEFTYNNMKIGKMKADDYINKKVADKNKKKPGIGDAWLLEFQADMDTAFPRYFINMFNMYKKHLAVADLVGVNADYVMKINTVFIEPGYNVGISSKRPEAAMDVSIVAKDNPDKVLAKLEITKAPGGSMFGSGYTFKDRVGGCYENAASRLASYFTKKKTF